MLLLLCLAPAQVSALTRPIGIAVGSDNLTRLLWNNSDGSIALWKIAVDGSVATQNSYGPYPGWLATSISMGPDNFARVLCTHPNDGQMSVWRVDPSSPASFNPVNYGPYTGWGAISVGVGGNNAPRILWYHWPDYQVSLWNITPDTNFTSANYGPYTDYQPLQVAAGPNSIPRTLWNKSDGSISLWYSTADAADFAHKEYGPYAGWSVVALAVDSNNAARILWSHPADGTVSLWRVLGDGSFTQQTYTNPSSCGPVALAAGTGGDVRLLWYDGQEGTLVWTIYADGSHAQTYPSSYPTVSSIVVNPSTITAGNTSTGTVYLNGLAPSGTTVSLNSTNATIHVPTSISVANSSSVSFPVTTSPGTYDYTSGTVYARVSQNSVVQTSTTVSVYTPGGTVTGGGGTGGGGTGTGGGGTGTGTGGGGTGTGGGGTGTGGGGTGTGTGGGGTGTGGGGTGTGGGGTATAGVNPHGYYSVSYSYSDGGGSQSPNGPSGITTPTVAYDQSYGDYVDAGDIHFSGSHGSGATAYMNGTFTATFTWHGDTAHPNSPAPAQVTVIKRSIASWGASYYNNISGNCSTGLTQRHTNAANPNNSDSLMEFGYETKGGPTFSVSCSPSAGVSYTSSVGAAPSTASAYARVSFTAAAVFMDIGGTTPDPNGTDDILIGQGCTAKLKGIPYGANGQPSVGTVTCNWIASGFMFHDWVVQENQSTRPHTSTATLLPGFETINQTTAHWYWSDESGVNNAPSIQSIKCVATFQPPTGPSFTSTSYGSVGLVEPNVDFQRTLGLVQLNNRYIPGNLSIYGLYAGPGLNNSPSDGIVFTGRVSTPAPFSGNAVWNFVQLVGPGIWETPKGGTEVGSRYNGNFGLDTTYPYEPGPYQAVASGYSADNMPYTAPDSPGIATLDAYKNYRISQNYVMYLMYLPPGSDAKWVPVKSINWSWSANVTLPGDSWSSWNASATGGNFTASEGQRNIGHPTWGLLSTRVQRKALSNVFHYKEIFMNRRTASTALVAAFLLSVSPAIAKHSVGDTPERRANFAKYAALEKQGDDLLVQGQFAEAEAYLRRALDFCPEDTSAQMHLGLALDQQGQTEEAFDFYQKAFSVAATLMSSNYPEDIEAYARYGLMCETRGRHVEAVQCFNQARRWAKAEPLLEMMDAQKDAPLKVRTMLTIMRGMAIEGATRQERVTRTAESLAAFQEAAAQMPNDAHAHFFLGNGLREAGRFGEAKAVLQKVPEMDADGSLKAATVNSLKQVEAHQR